MLKKVLCSLLFIVSLHVYSGHTEDSLISVILNYELKDSAEIDQMYRYTSEYTGSNIELAKILADTMIYQCKKINYIGGYLFGHIRKADILRFDGQTDYCIEFLNGFLATELVKNNQEMQARAYALLGAIYSDHGRIADCIEYNLKSLKIAEEQNILDLRSFLYNSLGLLYSNKDPQQSINYHKKALALNKELKDEKKIGVGYLNLGYTFHGMGEIDTAIMYFHKTLEIYEKLDYASGLASVNMNIGATHWRKKNYELALPYMRKALYYDLQVGSIPYIFDDYRQLGIFYLDIEAYDSSLIFLKKAHGIAQQEKLHNYLKASHGNLARYYKATSQLDSAYHHLQLSYRHKDTLNTEANKAKAKEIEEKYENDQKEAENKILKLENEQNEQMLRYQRNTVFVLSLVVILMVIFIISNLRLIRRKRMLNNELNESNLRLQEMNDMKVKFFSLISHDLRGPLGTLKGLSELLFSEERLAEKKSLNEKQARLFKDEIRNTYNLSNNLLTWARSQLDHLKFSPEQINYHEACEEVIKDFTVRLENKGVKVENLIHKDLVALADKNYLQTVCRNLISNAIKYSHQGSTITISAVKNEDDMTVLEIRDRGVGMDSETVHNLFKVDKATSTPGTLMERGTGLGLLLCKEFIDKHNGKIEVESEVNVGTVIKVKIPRELHMAN